MKKAVFPFNKFPNSDLLLDPEMKSKGKNNVSFCTYMSTAQASLEAIQSLKTKKLVATSLHDI